MLLFIRLGRADGKCLVLHGRIHFVSNGQGEIILDHFHFNHNFRIFDFSGCFDRIVQKIRNKRTEMMIGDRQMWRQYDLNIHRDLMLVCHCIFDVDHLVDDLISCFNLIIESIDFLGKTVKIFFQGIVFVLAEQTIG